MLPPKKRKLSKKNADFSVNQHNKTVYISNLSYQRDEAGLRELFARYGQVVSIKIILDDESGRPKGMAFVEMGKPIEAQNAIRALNTKEVDGRTLKVYFANPLKVKAPSRERDPDERREKREKRAMREKQEAEAAEAEVMQDEKVREKVPRKRKPDLTTFFQSIKKDK